MTRNMWENKGDFLKHNKKCFLLFKKKNCMQKSMKSLGWKFHMSYDS